MASWEIFCSVVDNYGDIGVTWRLAVSYTHL
ncbi:elongation factor P maturation arginine rhamnosyltransferase EarP, partial [Pseudomonas aeruginosa]|nr:elongation factor P maturation arginine rhamnosyltransferase EarP [Pseudomonas aeruginosa]